MEVLDESEPKSYFIGRDGKRAVPGFTQFLAPLLPRDKL
jgi:hypothetical protein